MSGPVKVFYKGENIDFIVFVESEEIAQKYQKDSTIPLSEVVGTFKIFTSDQRRGSEGVFDEASRQELETEFGTKSVEEAIEKIIKEGTYLNATSLNKKTWNSTNDSMGRAAV
ncbi:CYFA0S07e03026g1_1 [Cyberlindnera fabianii]|uniref:CYFA0S07e03026g1_1 n=1 Tax=Cyberlindnera fabianii TaxID=36022 RepID=A0A061AV85_CYBFA|nr:Restriction of telomere capping protein 3 [Cyberlindnera fabianii]CDR41514.1 CYFA0S07e03026g1_1 [Cyberlindnera fabianii]